MNDTKNGVPLQGRIALVTGASRGIGASTAKALFEAGAQVIVTDIVDATNVANEICGISKHLDVADEQTWIEVAEFVKTEFGGLDILVNNAGRYIKKPLIQTTLQEWRNVHAVNVEGVFLGCKHLVPLMAERARKWAGGCSIVNMSSTAGLVGSGNATCYGASKGAVRFLTKSLAIELAPLMIRVNSVHPGLIKTQMGDQVIKAVSRNSSLNEDQVRRMIARQHPLGHSGNPSNVADGIVFLASDRAAFMTGTELVIDGGMTAQ